VIAGAEVGSGVEVGGGHILPLVDDEPTIHIKSHAVVGTGMEGIIAGARAQGGCPSHGEVIRRDRGVRRALAPVEVYVGVLSGEGG